MQRELVEAARNGDREAFGVLAGGAVDRLYAIARLILRDTDLAEDATQEALVLGIASKALVDASLDEWAADLLGSEGCGGSSEPIVVDGATG